MELNDDEKFKKIFKLLYSINRKEDIFQHFHVDKAFDVRILSVDSLYRGQGIAKHLVKHSEDLAKECEFKVSLLFGLEFNIKCPLNIFI